MGGGGGDKSSSIYTIADTPDFTWARQKNSTKCEKTLKITIEILNLKIVLYEIRITLLEKGQNLLN